MSIEARVVSDRGELEAVLASWDALAVRCAAPYSSPGWMLSWWDAAAPAGARLFVAIAVEGDSLAGALPGFVERSALGVRRLRLLSSRVSVPVSPLAVAGRVEEAARALAAAIAATGAVDALVLEGLPDPSPWPEALARAWDGEAWVHRDYTRVAPVVSLAGTSHDVWFSARGRNFRQQMRRSRRQLDEAGARFRLVESEDLDEALAGFARLHYARWRDKGGSMALTPRIETMLAEAGRRLPLGTRFRLWSLELGDASISAHLYVAAGGRVNYWLGGFDESWARQRPALQVLWRGIEHAWEVGDDVVDLGYGPQGYKQRLATGEEVRSWVTVVPQGPSYALTRMRLAPRIGARAVSERVPDEVKRRIRSGLRRSQD